MYYYWVWAYKVDVQNHPSFRKSNNDDEKCIKNSTVNLLNVKEHISQ